MILGIPSPMIAPTSPTHLRASRESIASGAVLRMFLIIIIALPVVCIPSQISGASPEAATTHSRYDSS